MDEALSTLRRTAASVTAQLTDRERNVLMARFGHDPAKIETICRRCREVVRVDVCVRDGDGKDVCEGCRDAQ